MNAITIEKSANLTKIQREALKSVQYQGMPVEGGKLSELYAREGLKKPNGDSFDGVSKMVVTDIVVDDSHRLLQSVICDHRVTMMQRLVGQTWKMSACVIESLSKPAISAKPAVLDEAGAELEPATEAIPAKPGRVELSGVDVAASQAGLGYISGFGLNPAFEAWKTAFRGGAAAEKRVKEKV